jgi:hypothetical protein
MKKIYYEKVGRRYKPVAEYDNDLMDSFHKGNHLVMVYPGGTSRRFNIDPAMAPMIAAGRVAEDAMCKAMMDASELRPQRTPLTEGQQRAWKAMQVEADKLMQHPAVRDAYEQFQLVCKLTKQKDCHKD